MARHATQDMTLASPHSPEKPEIVLADRLRDLGIVQDILEDFISLAGRTTTAPNVGWVVTLGRRD